MKNFFNKNKNLFFLFLGALFLSYCDGSGGAGSGSGTGSGDNRTGLNNPDVKRFVTEARAFQRPIQQRALFTIRLTSVKQREEACELETKVGKDSHKTATSTDVNAYKKFDADQQDFFKSFSSLIAGATTVPVGTVVANGLFALYFAAREGNLCLVKALAERGANLNRINASASNSTALHTAAQNDDIPVIKYLVGRQGIVIDTLAGAGGLAGYTALHQAASWRKLEAVKALRQAGADKTIIAGGNTPAQIATARGGNVGNAIATWLNNN